ncbi:hypothetical protein N8T08_002866 [Aspergillus melleus]|uniref:Uncharacterized protein n=1 Tax=Aspergillus melleus TaxID=138277 RepID=A0ACC3B7T6_9EURO|nr:hypothetical protein N8T08_002866 [Aspergillus melleus]
MPMFQDPDRQQFYDLWSDDQREPDEGARQHAIPTWKQYQVNHSRFGRSERGDIFSDEPSWPEYPMSRLRASDREDLIRYIKSSDASPWAPQTSFEEPSAGHFPSDKPDYMADQSFERSLPKENHHQEDQELGSPADIVRPRSALHSGDFREGAREQNGQQQIPPSPIPRTTTVQQFPPLSSSPTTPWFAVPARPSAGKPVPATRSRAPSLGSFSSSYVLKAPTRLSPQIRQNSRKKQVVAERCLQKVSDTSNHLLLLTEARSFRMSPAGVIGADAISKGSEAFHYFGIFAPATCLACRLIGVLGKSKCKSGLKCPPHVTVPFPAVFYSYPTSGYGRTISDDNPSPYVGLIDLENSLPRDTSASSRRRRRHQSPAGPHGDQGAENELSSKPTDQDALRKREKRHRRAESPKCPPGGCYRIPQQGQLQIMIKNPNKTAVKLFLVPYDLGDMEPGTKTFIRQRSYSAGPVIDMPLTARKNYGTDRPEASLNTSEDPKDKPILRYLIHLNICCPSRGRFYLHSSIRVVFANRVPDGKEQLRNEIQHPDPRYTPYKPVRDAHHSHMVPKLATDRSSQRPAANHEPIAAYDAPHPSADIPDSSFAIPSSLRRNTMNPGQYHSVQHTVHPFQPIPSLRKDSFSLQELDSIEPHRFDEDRYHKLNRGDIGYGGYPSVGSFEAGESLLAKRLRGLDVHKHDCPDLN